ncbi:TadE family protein [Aporhodopirellula aestuarii]|uniref:Pilus assembly protein n=1 Tax=Aporhodopirellula aestuarii TaxID=2950107 RepID=A0ABT0U7N1_9BACT|nr:TadE family protein [Aporhodopirellula aestuarii]MCM2372428.1 pilus assembly protein [Aporhodopirellula aestuarii]
MNAPKRITPADNDRSNRRFRFGRAPRRVRSTRHGGGFLGIKRAATATAEVAICLPVLMTLTLATIDLCSVFFLKETISIAAYEGARRGVNRGGTNAAAISRVQQVLNERGIDYGGGSITFEGATFDNAETLEHVTLVVTVPAAGNLAAPAGLYGDLVLTSRVTMRKEFQNQE